MTPTTLKLSQELKARVAAVVKGADKSMHAFVLEAIEQQTQLAERRKSFVADALDASDDLERTRVGYASADVHTYMDRRVRGEMPRRPKAKRWRKLFTPSGHFQASKSSSNSSPLKTSHLPGKLSQSFETRLQSWSDTC